MGIEHTESESGRSTERRLIICFSNFGGKNHPYCHKSKNAFFDLWPEDRSACHAEDLEVG